MPTVSVIVPNYNHAPFLRQRIETILGQTYQDFELILLDDCSTDNSREILKKYADDARLAAPARVRVEFNEKNSGSPFKQWNKGVRMARGKYVWIAESDDYSDARFLERLVPILENDADVQFAYCRSQQVIGNGKILGLLGTFVPGVDNARWNADFCVDGEEELRRSMVYGCIVENASAVVIRKAAYEQAGGADESFRICGDWKLWCTLMLAGKMAYVAEPLNYFRFHEGAARNRFGLWGAGIVEWLAVVRWLLDRVDVPEAELRQVRAYHADRWTAALLRTDVPRAVKREILRRAKTIDAHAIRSGMRAALLLAPSRAAEGARQMWCKVWYGLLDLTYGMRHSRGLTREGLARVRAKAGRE
ncbi:MAG TPA: glycosyltransferase [Candidatus Acidoferrum sp.]|nr:glycosyltransferase [Candidatus Acidoferrum sp.]